MDLERLLSQPSSFGTNYLTTYARARVFLSINLKPTFLRTIILVIRKTYLILYVSFKFKFTLINIFFNSNFFTLLSA